jgi:plastocyanin
MTTSGDFRLSTQHALTSLVLLGIVAPCAAAGLDVGVVDNGGRPVEDVAVYAMPSMPAPPPSATAPTAVMDQLHNEFVPHLLVVQTGTSVLFPNGDNVSHHVYSFSEPKAFELPLYKGNAHPPLVFDRPGVVVLGCNIHDGMLGYIRVVDTPYFATTDARGKAALDELPPGKYTVYAWTPRLRSGDLPAGVAIDLHDETADVAFRLDGKLAPEHDHGGSGLTWQRY